MTDGVKRDDEYNGTRPVEDRHRFDEIRLEEWMREHVEGYEGPLTVLQFKGGQSNPTYRLNTPKRSYVMRRKPFGKLLPSAHAVDREYKVIAALGKQGFPVAKAYALCTDDAVIGSAFYIMSMEDGRIFWDPALPNVDKSERRAIFTAKIETLAQLHSYDPEKIGLGDFGRPGNYFARQVDRWTKQYRASETQLIPEMERLIEWLPTSVPDQERLSVVHGDYRIDNMVFNSTQPKVQAVLDWELSTLGDPMADFTYLLMQWIMPGLEGLDYKALDIPTMDESGLKGFDNGAWGGLVFPAGTPQPIVDRASVILEKVINSKEVKDDLAKAFATPMAGTQKDFAQFVAVEQKKWADVISDAKIEKQN